MNRVQLERCNNCGRANYFQKGDDPFGMVVEALQCFKCGYKWILNTTSSYKPKLDEAYTEIGMRAPDL